MFQAEIECHSCGHEYTVICEYDDLPARYCVGCGIDFNQEVIFYDEDIDDYFTSLENETE